MGKSLLRHYPRPLQERAKRGRAGKIRPQHQRIHKKADEVFHFHAPPVGDGRANDHVRLSRITVEQRLKGGQQEGEQREFFLSA